ncbi:hypothetical protein PIB30_048649 [Stylosanthes scabra]|uniref:Uncharacterized protein n=1 Tax=Stylosanthes scabra TaxID=79078 RepID=A0ABU6WGT2_9FABA|nr:hypothetical protein [Stylosanthes scabra]
MLDSNSQTFAQIRLASQPDPNSYPDPPTPPRRSHSCAFEQLAPRAAPAESSPVPQDLAPFERDEKA